MSDDEKLRAEIKRLRTAIKDQDDRLAAATERLEKAAGSRTNEPLRSSAAARMRAGYAANDERAAAWLAANPGANPTDQYKARLAGFPMDEDDA